MTHKLSILQMNMWRGGSKVPNGLARTVDIIKQTPTDVALLSETDNNAPAKVAQALGAGWYSAGTGDTGVVSRYPILYSSQYTATPNYWTKAVLDCDDNKVTVYSVHLEYRWYTPYLIRGYGSGEPGSPTGWGPLPNGPVTDTAALHSNNMASGRTSTIEALMTDASVERLAGRRVFIGGDFNEPSHLDWTAATKTSFGRNGVSYQWDTTKALEAQGWVDGYRAKHPDVSASPALTWPSDNADSTPEVLGEGINADMRDRLDFIFHAPQAGLVLESATLIGPAGTIAMNTRQPQVGVDQYTPFNGSWPSDHKGNLQKFSFDQGDSMGSIDSNGIWKYDMADKVNGWPAYSNLATNSVSNVIKDIRPKIVYTATSQSDATSKANTMKNSGLTPTTTSPFFFWRADTKSLWVYDGSTWFDSDKDDSGWKAHGGAAASGITFDVPIQYRVINGVVYWRGQFHRNGGAALTDFDMITGVAGESRPPVETPLVISVNGGTQVSAKITPEGTIRVYGGSSVSWPILGGNYAK